MANSNASSFWSGLALGVVGSALVAYLVTATNDLTEANKKKPLTAQQKKDQDDISFDFYKMLPELEIVVPESIEAQPLRETLVEETLNVDATKPIDNRHKQAIQKIESLPGSYFLQTGSFTDIDEAQRMKVKLSFLGFEVSVQKVNVNGRKYQRVRIGPFAQLAVFSDAKNMLTSNGIKYISLKAR